MHDVVVFYIFAYVVEFSPKRSFLSNSAIKKEKKMVSKEKKKRRKCSLRFVRMFCFRTSANQNKNNYKYYTLKNVFYTCKAVCDKASMKTQNKLLTL